MQPTALVIVPVTSIFTANNVFHAGTQWHSYTRIIYLERFSLLLDSGLPTRFLPLALDLVLLLKPLLRNQAVQEFLVSFRFGVEEDQGEAGRGGGGGT